MDPFLFLSREFIKDCNTGMGKPPPEGQEYKYCRKMYQNGEIRHSLKAF